MLANELQILIVPPMAARIPPLTWPSFFFSFLDFNVLIKLVITKKTKFLKVLIGVILFSCSLAQAYTVIIDPGHGGTDKGATRTIFQESIITLQLSQKIHEIIKKQYPDINSRLTREQDINISLEDRVIFANKHKADLFVSIHANSSPAKSISGMEFYFKQGLTTETSHKALNQKIQFLIGKNLADVTDKNLQVVQKMTADVVDWGQLQSSYTFNKILQNNIDITKSIIRRAPFYVIENLAIPSVLIEIGYISNISEAKKLLNDDYQNQIAQSIVKSISEFRNHSLNFESISN